MTSIILNKLFASFLIKQMSEILNGLYKKAFAEITKPRHSTSTVNISGLLEFCRNHLLKLDNKELQNLNLLSSSWDKIKKNLSKMTYGNKRISILADENILKIENSKDNNINECNQYVIKNIMNQIMYQSYSQLNFVSNIEYFHLMFRIPQDIAKNIKKRVEIKNE